MKVWLGGNVDYTIADSYRVIRNKIEKKINSLIEHKDYGVDIISLDITFVIRDDINQDVFKFSKKTKESDIEINILLEKFISFSEKEKVEILLNHVVKSLEIIVLKYNLKCPLENFKNDIINNFSYE